MLDQEKEATQDLANRATLLAQGVALLEQELASGIPEMQAGTARFVGYFTDGKSLHRVAETAMKYEMNVPKYKWRQIEGGDYSIAIMASFRAPFKPWFVLLRADFLSLAVVRAVTGETMNAEPA